MSVEMLRGPVEVRIAQEWVSLPGLYPVDPEQQRTRNFRVPTYFGRHECRCGGCDAELRVPKVPTNPVAHFMAIREPQLRVTWDGHEWPHVLEVQVGVGGWALVLSDPGHRCDCPAGGTCVYKIRGDHFSVEGRS